MSNDLAAEFGAILDTLDHAIGELTACLTTRGVPTYGVRAIERRVGDDLATLALIATRSTADEAADAAVKLDPPVQCVRCGRGAAWLYGGSSWCRTHVPSYPARRLTTR